ncbi:hypothetical protein OQA88_11066 [Cercophora sp. LCS_1]
MAKPEASALMEADDAQAQVDVADDATDIASDTTSLMSDVLKYRHENGRTYHGYKDGTYVLPNDPTEQQRLDLQHNLLILTFGGKLFNAPLPRTPSHVLDAGCGSGIWSIDFADEHPESKASITGIDLSPTQPAFVPPNVTFYVDDLEDTWNFSHKFDFIFSRFMTGSILDWPQYFKQCYDALEPGGWLEVQDILYPMESDDGTLTPDSPLRKWSELLLEGFTGIGRPLNTAFQYKDQLLEAGFVEIGEIKAKWPSNGWPRDPILKQIGEFEGANGRTISICISNLWLSVACFRVSGSFQRGY